VPWRDSHPIFHWILIVSFEIILSGRLRRKWQRGGGSVIRILGWFSRERVLGFVSCGRDSIAAFLRLGDTACFWGGCWRAGVKVLLRFFARIFRRFLRECCKVCCMIRLWGSWGREVERKRRRQMSIEVSREYSFTNFMYFFTHFLLILSILKLFPSPFPKISEERSRTSP
jgi:hypothetical protein